MPRALLTIRIVCAAVFVGGIAGMIVSSIAGNNAGWVLTAGAATAIAAIVLMAASAVAQRPRVDVFEEEVIRRVEDRIAALVAAGADEGEIRELVADALRIRGGWLMRR